MTGNTNYYQSSTGGEIMSSRNFNDGVISLLRTESAFISRILLQQKYATLLEMGCDLARNYDIAWMHNIKYIGVDIRKNVIDSLLQRAKYSSMYEQALFINDEVINIDRIRTQLNLGRSTLCLLPFNIIGNFTELDLIFSKYAVANMDVIISSWQCSPQASIARSDYYIKCGIVDLDFIETNISHCFTCSDFRSEAYNQLYLNKIATKFGFILSEKFDTNFINLLYFRRSEA